MHIQFSHTYGCYVWTCLAGHLGLDFESQAEAEDDFAKHKCPFN